MADTTDTTDLAQLRRDLRDLWEGCVPWSEAIQMIGAADHPNRKELQADYRRWTRRLEAGQRAY